jgi:hypothetical protein
MHRSNTPSLPLSKPLTPPYHRHRSKNQPPYHRQQQLYSYNSNNSFIHAQGLNRL